MKKKSARTKKVVINRCFGGFSLSKKGVKMMAELAGRECFFFEGGISEDYKRVDENGGDDIFWSAFDVPSVSRKQAGDDDFYRKHAISSRPENREDKNLIKVVEALGKEANGGCADLSVAEIPQGVEYTIEEYDGLEHIAEVHKTWR